MEDLIPLILQYASFLPKYRRVSKTWNKATDINIQLGCDIGTHISKNYPELINIMYMQLDPKFDESVWILYVNMMSYNKDWESMIKCISDCNCNPQIIDQILRSLHINGKFDICNNIYKKICKYNFVGHFFMEEHYTYEYYFIFMLYYMFLNNHKNRYDYLSFTLRYGSFVRINICGFIHPDMISYIRDTTVIPDNSYAYKILKSRCGDSFIPDDNLASDSNFDMTKEIVGSKCIKLSVLATDHKILHTKETLDKIYNYFKSNNICIEHYNSHSVIYRCKDLWSKDIEKKMPANNTRQLAIKLALKEKINIDKLIQ